MDDYALGQGFTGGVVIAIASSLHLLLHGRITGISGIVNGILTTPTTHQSIVWRYCFLAGLLTMGYLGVGFDGMVPPLTGAEPTLALSVVSGLLVGWGTRMGSGCTSGHGVCGLPRFSRRSFAAVLCFMGAGMFVATTLRPYVLSVVPHDTMYAQVLIPDSTRWLIVALVNVSVLICLLASAARTSRNACKIVLTEAATYAIGGTFGFGLLVSGMTSCAKVIGFLRLLPFASWDPTLAMVMGGAVCVNVVTFSFILKRREAVWGPLQVPSSTEIPVKLLVGSVVFGVGWGLAGLCPAPALVAMTTGKAYGIAFVAAMLAGMRAYTEFGA